MSEYTRVNWNLREFFAQKTDVHQNNTIKSFPKSLLTLHHGLKNAVHAVTAALHDLTSIQDSGFCFMAED